MNKHLTTNIDRKSVLVPRLFKPAEQTFAMTVIKITLMVVDRILEFRKSGKNRGGHKLRKVRRQTFLKLTTLSRG